LAPAGNTVESHFGSNAAVIVDLTSGTRRKAGESLIPVDLARMIYFGRGLHISHDRDSLISVSGRGYSSDPYFTLRKMRALTMQR
jgi:hypothetical protein